MRALLITVCTTLLLASAGCTRLGGKFQSVDRCSSSHVLPEAALASAPKWVPGSPARATMPNGCVGGDGMHHTDRLCAVAEVTDVDAVATSEDLAVTKSLRLLAEELDRRLQAVMGSSASSNESRDLSKQLTTAIGRTTAHWRSPNCTVYAIAEIKLADFQFVIQGPSLSTEARTRLLSNADRIIGDQ